MPPERLSRSGAAKFSEEVSLPLETESQGPKPGGNLRGIRRSRESMKIGLYQSLRLAVGAVICERVSAGGFPANRERYRENGHFDGAYPHLDPLIATGFH